MKVNANANRDLLAQAAIVLAVCVGGWMMLVKPKVDELARVEQTIAEHESASASAINQQSVQQAANRMSQIKGRLEQVTEQNRLASDSSKLYGLVMDMADSHGVTVQSLQPGAVRMLSDDGKMSATRLNMTVQGTYESIAEFFDAVCGLQAFIRPLSMQITPTREEGRTIVDADFGCDVMSFVLEDSLVELAGGSHAQP